MKSRFGMARRVDRKSIVASYDGDERAAMFQLPRISVIVSKYDNKSVQIGRKTEQGLAQIQATFAGCRS